MKKLSYAGLLLLTASLLAACDGGGPTPTTYDLTVNLSGVTSAPVKVTNTTTNTVIFDGTLDTSKTFAGITANSVLKVEGQAVNGYNTPAAQTVTLDSNKTLTVVYKQNQAQPVNASRYTGQLQPWTFKTGEIAVYYQETRQLQSTSPAAISATGTFDAALPTPTKLASLMGSCTFSGTQTVADIQTISATPVILSSGGDYLGDLIEVTSDGQEVVRQYADQNASFKGAVACPDGSKLSIDLQLVKGWNALAISRNATTNTVMVTSLPAGTSTSFSFSKESENLNIIFTDQSALTIKAGEQVSRNVTMFQNGGISGDMTFETNVRGLTVKPKTLTFAPLSALNLTAQSLETTLVFEADANAVPYHGELIVYALKNGVRVGSGKLPSFTLQVPYVMPTVDPVNSSVQLPQGETKEVTFSVLSQSGFTGTTTVTLGNLPAGVTASTETITLTSGSSGTVTVKLTASATATTGSFSAKVTGPKVHTYQGGMDSIPVTITPARSALQGNVTTAVPAAQGIWVLAPNLSGNGATLQLVQAGQPVKSFPLAGRVTLLAAPNGNAVTISEVNNNTVMEYTTTLFDASGSVGTTKTTNSADGQFYAYGAVDGSGFLWFMRDTTDRTNGSTSAALTKLNLTTGNTQEVTGSQFVMHEQLFSSADGKILIIPTWGNSSTFTRVNTQSSELKTVTLTNASAMPPFIVTNSGDVFTGETNLTKITPDGTVSTFNAPENLSMKLIGVDRVEPQVLWVESGGQLVKFNSVTAQFTKVTALPTAFNYNYAFGSVAGSGGVGLITKEQVLNNQGNYDTHFFVGFIK